MGLLERIEERMEARNSVDWYAQQVIAAATQFSFGGHGYQVTGLQQSLLGARAREVVASLPAYMRALRSCPPAFAAQMVRSMVLSQMRFAFRNVPWHATTPRRVWGSPALSKLERPWPNATTSQLVAHMEWHEGLAGNSYVVDQPKRLRVLRPDFTGILYGSSREPDDPMHAIDGEVLGYVYRQGGFGPGGNGRLETFMPNEVAHWSPLPDPESPGIGMSWITPILRDIQGDRAATEHKLMFFENGATPNMVVRGLPTTKELFDQAVDMIEEKHKGLRNAYRTLFLSEGADATVVGATPQQMEFVGMQGKGETRIAMSSRVPASVLQISEGLQGSALNVGAWGAARRNFADTFIYSYMQDLAACMAQVVNVPADSELWFDPTDMPILREDAKDQAEIASTDAGTITQLINGGYDPDAAVAAVMGRNLGVLKGKHSGLVSVQLQPPGTWHGGAEPSGSVDAIPGGKAPAALPPGQKQLPATPAKAKRTLIRQTILRDERGALIGRETVEEELDA